MLSQYIYVPLFALMFHKEIYIYIYIYVYDCDEWDDDTDHSYLQL